MCFYALMGVLCACVCFVMDVMTSYWHCLASGGPVLRLSCCCRCQLTRSHLCVMMHCVAHAAEHVVWVVLVLVVVLVRVGCRAHGVPRGSFDWPLPQRPSQGAPTFVVQSVICVRCAVHVTHKCQYMPMPTAVVLFVLPRGVVQ